MSYITLGNLTRFLNKLKTYIGNNYLNLTGGTVTGDTIFRKKISAHEVCLTGLSDVSLINKDNGSIAKDGLTILDEGNYNLFTPTIHGAGATGTWDINISGNALNDSEGNKIVDTYAKKSDIPTDSAPDLTLYMKKTADSDLSMGGYALLFPSATISTTTFNSAPMLTIKQAGGGVNVDGHLLMNNVNVATEDYVRTNYVQLSNGHISINGSELWVE